MMNFYPGFNIRPTIEPMGFEYGPGVFGPGVENRSLNSIRRSLRDPECSGPDPVYAIAMDVGKKKHHPLLKKLHLLFGAVTYATGCLGEEPVRSQGHIHKISQFSGWSTPEVYEIWSGQAIIYMQEAVSDQPGRCYAVAACPGEIVIVPPGWAHTTVSADPEQPLTFGAWCDREYGFEYEEIRARKGLAWYPVIGQNQKIEWRKNPGYHRSELIIKEPAKYLQFNLDYSKPIYQQFEEDPLKFLFVPQPQLLADIWQGFVP